MFFGRRAGSKLVDRGDPAAWDKTVADLTQDIDWHDLDFSAVLPANAKFVLIYFSGTGVAIPTFISFRKKGNTNVKNVTGFSQSVIGTEVRGSFKCPVSTDGKINYTTEATTWVGANMSVRGWYI